MIYLQAKQQQKMFSNLFLESQLNTKKQVCFPKKNVFHNTNES